LKFAVYKIYLRGQNKSRILAPNYYYNKIKQMKKIYILALSAIALATTSFAQSEVTFSGTPVNIGDQAVSLDHYSKQNSSARATQFCADTNLWAWGRSFDAQGATYLRVTMHKQTLTVNRMGTYVDVPAGTGVMVRGFQFLAKSARPDGNTVSVNAVLYKAGADSLPTGAAVATATIALDTMNWTRTAVFTVPGNVTGSFILTVENSITAGDSIDMLVGRQGSGFPDGEPIVISADDVAAGAFFRPVGTGFGSVLPHIYPIVNFQQTSTFVMSVSQLSGPNEDVDMMYTGYSMKNHPIWSIDGFLGNPTTYYSVDGGSSFNVASNGDTTITFVDPYTDYSIVMNDSITMWSNPACVISESTTLLGKPNGIEDHDANELKAYFSNGELNIINGNGEATLYSITGRMVKQFVLINQFETVDVSDLNEGVYILQVGDSVTKMKL
jgi:hypothetical protein